MSEGESKLISKMNRHLGDQSQRRRVIAKRVIELGEVSVEDLATYLHRRVTDDGIPRCGGP